MKVLKQERLRKRGQGKMVKMGRRKWGWSEPPHSAFLALNPWLALQTSFMVGVIRNANHLEGSWFFEDPGTSVELLTTVTSCFLGPPVCVFYLATTGNKGDRFFHLTGRGKAGGKLRLSGDV